MSRTHEPVPDTRAAWRLTGIRWHRPLLGLAVAMAVLAVISLVGLVIDPRTITGLPLWAKPLKFALSIAIYALTLSWLVGQLARGRRLAWWAGTVAAVLLLVEMVIIVGAALAGTTSHFNVATPLAITLWTAMALSIMVVWAAAVPVAILLFRARLDDPARSLAIRAGLVIALIGMALAFFMTAPTASQLSDFQGVAGAHTVGLPDGGPGLPLLGWSTVAGDLRVPHFVGMHALQVIPLAALLLEILGHRLPVLRQAVTRARILWVLIALYAGVLALLTVQALAGQSVVRPDAGTITVALVLWAGAAAAVALVVGRGRLHASDAAPRP